MPPSSSILNNTGPILSPAVLTSTAADNHINSVVKPAVTAANASLQSAPSPSTVNTSTPAAAPTPTTSATTQAPSTSTSAPSQNPLNTYSYISTDGTSKTIQATDPNAAMTQAKDIAAHSGVQSVPTPPTAAPTPATAAEPTTPTPTTAPSTNSSNLSSEQDQLKQAQADYSNQASYVQNQITGIQSGAIPLSPSETAQVTALSQQYQQLIDQQKLTNTGATGQANVRGYQTGAAEYDPMFQVKTIGDIVSAGQQKIGNLAIQEAGALATLTQSLKNNDIAAIKDSWAVYQDSQSKRQDAIQKTIDATNAAITAAQTAQQKQIDAVNSVAAEAAKNGAPASVLAQISAAGTESAAITLASDYMQTGTGQIGDYLQYKRDALAAGVVPHDYATWKAQDDARIAKQKADDAFAIAKGTASGKAAGTPAKVSVGTVGGNTDSPSSDIKDQDAQAILEGRNTLQNIRLSMGRTNSAATYMQDLRSLIMKQDPNFDFVASDAGGKSVSTPYVQRATSSINSVLPNIDKVVDLSNQVSRVGVTGVDKLLQSGEVTINNQKVANLHEAQKLIADEIGVALGAGSVSDMKLQLGFDVTDPSVSPEVFASNMGIVKDFLNKRKEGLASLRYTSSTVTNPVVQSQVDNPANLPSPTTANVSNPLNI